MDGYLYDAAGNLLNDGVHNYLYDAENRITQVDGGVTASYVYDASGRRVRKVSSAGTIDYLFDFSNREITLLTATSGWYRGEIYAAGRHVGSYFNGNTYFTHVDWLGTERARTNASGATTETCTSLPFGDWLSCNGTDTTNLHLTGQEHDAETALDHFDARSYSGSLGRWLSPDWSESPSTVPYANSVNPQTLNLYAYVRNNPVSLTDRRGHSSDCFAHAECGADPFGQQEQNHRDDDTPRPSAHENLLTRILSWISDFFSHPGQGPSNSSEGLSYRGPAGVIRVVREANEYVAPVAAPIRKVTPSKIHVDAETGIPGLGFSSDLELSLSTNAANAPHLKKWGHPTLSITAEWNPPSKEDDLGEVHANYLFIQGGTHITPDGPGGFALGVGPKAELPVGGSVSQTSLENVWDGIVDFVREQLHLHPDK